MTVDRAIIIDANGLRSGLMPRPMPLGPPSIAALLDDLGTRDGIALIDRDGAISYHALAIAVDAAAAGLQARGVGVGSVVAASCANHNELIIAFLATQRIGAIWIGINRALAPPEKRALLADSRAMLFLATADIAAEVDAAAAEAPLATMTIGGGASDFAAMIASHNGKRPASTPRDAHRPAIIGYTSGTTGIPKGVVHSQHGMLCYINACLHSDQGGQWQFGLRRSLNIALTIMNGMIYGPLVALTSGGTFVTMDRSDAEGVGEWIDRHGIEVLNCPPTTIRDLLLAPDLQRFSLASLKAVAAGGSVIEDSLSEAFRARFGFELIADYGITESPSGMASSRVDRPRKTGYVGPAHPHLAIAILDEEGRPLAPDTVGELCAGPRREGPWAGVYTAMLGYWHKPEETRAAFHGAWLRTGDMARMDADGDIAIIGRKKEMILRGGANIYPAEIERVLNAHASILEAVVMGVPDARLGQIVAAYIQLQPGTPIDAGLRPALQDYCRSQLARYKVPEQWIVIDEIPRNAMRKPQKTLLATVSQTLLD